MNERNKRLPIRGAHSAEAAAAERLKARGDANFESVYGSMAPGTFNMTEDIEAMTGVIQMPEETKKLVTPQNNSEKKAASTPNRKAAGFSMPSHSRDLPQDAPVSPLGPTNEEEDIEETEEEEDEPELTVEEKCQKLHEFLVSVTEASPGVATLLSWKRMHGDIFMLHLNGRVFLFRYLKRQELIQMKANPKFDELPEHSREEDIYRRCLLWPQSDPIQEASDPAGLMSMLSKQIKLQSMFLDEMYVAQLVLKV